MKRNRLAGLASLMLAVACVSACSSTPRPLYVPFGPSNYGYSERSTGDASYEVSYRAPRFNTYVYGQTARDRIVDQQLAIAHDIALLRASDLALSRGMPAFREIRRDNDVRVDVENDPFYNSSLNRPCYDTRFCTPPPYLSSDRRTVVDAGVRIEVRLEPRVDGGAYDAADSKRRLLLAYPDALPPRGTPQVPGGPIGGFNGPGGS
jgi:hypothetical protein